MAIFPIRTFGDPVLRAAADPVGEVDDSVQHLIDDLLETMFAAPGVGLAAPQIGFSKRVIVFDVGEGENALINPELIEATGEWEFDEGCLSVPDRFWPISRPARAKVKGIDRDSNEVVVEGDELLGRVLQHELDHLEGKLLLERLSRKARKEALRDLRFEAMGLQTGK